MRSGSQTTPKSDCIHCVLGWAKDARGRAVGTRWLCEIDEYDRRVGCDGRCASYRRRAKERAK